MKGRAAMIAALVAAVLGLGCKDARTGIDGDDDGDDTGYAVPAHLLDPATLSYLGAFDIPPGHWQDPQSQQCAYSLGTIAYRSDDNSIYVTTHAQSPNHLNRFQVPADFTGTPTATPIATGIALPEHDPALSVRTRGLYFDAGSGLLYYTQYVWYNVAGTPMATLAAIDPDTATHYGPWWVGTNNATAGPIAVADGKMVIGASIATGVASSNQGPTALEIDPFALPAPGSTLPFTTLMAHPYDANYSTSEFLSTGARWHHGMEYWGFAIIGDTALYFIDEGSVEFYGLPAEFEAQYGFTPRNSGKGYHNDIFRPMVFIYDRADFERVRSGEITADAVNPVAYYRLPQLPDNAYIGGVSVDPVNRRLFVSQAKATADRAPRIHVYQW